MLLAFLPYSEDESVEEEIKAALTGMAYHDGKADPALLKALEDDSPLRRSTAVDVLCENGLAEPRDALRKLLADPKPTVRLRAALALAQVRDANAVDTLIDLLGQLPAVQGRNAEEYLSGLAGDQSPKENLTDDASRAKVHDAWAAWWKSTGGTASLDEFTKRTLTEADREKAEKLIHQLGDDLFDVRQKAKTELKNMGVVVVRMLKTAANDPEFQVSESTAPSCRTSRRTRRRRCRRWPPASWPFASRRGRPRRCWPTCRSATTTRCWPTCRPR